MTRITNKTILLFFLLLHDLPPYLKASFEKVSTSASYQVVLPSLLLLWSWCIVSPPSYSCVTYRLQILPRLLSFGTSSLCIYILLRLFSHGPRAPPNIKVRKAYWHPNGTCRPRFGHLIFSWYLLLLFWRYTLCSYTHVITPPWTSQPVSSDTPRCFRWRVVLLLYL